ncbi:tetratricopeptide repeat-containing sensor histidine kinase [Pollutibacter soli]|uniref:tetratricopeptide repeat-containing sensor histidine kinase n=1 Tax=Pollutibacter soli TaxID=3034157 RepID=UPI003013CD95
MRISFIWVVTLSLSLSTTAKAQKLAGNEHSVTKGKSIITPTDTAVINAVLQKSRSFILKPGEDHKDLDSAIFLANQAEASSRQTSYAAGIAHAMILSGMATREKGNTDKGKTLAVRAIQYCSEQKEYDWLGEAYLQLMHYYSPWVPGEMTERIRIIKMADSAYQKSGNKQQRGYALQNLGDCYQVIGQPHEALKYLKQAQLMYESIGYKEIHGLYDLMGFCYAAYFNDHQTGLKYALMAASRAEELNDTTSQRGTIYSRLGQVYSYLSDYKKADEYYGKAYQLFKKYHETGNMYIVGINSASNFEYSNNFDLTMKYLLEVDQTETVPDFLRADYEAVLLQVYNKTRNRNKTDILLNSILKRPTSKEHPISISSLITYYTDAGQFNEAENWLKTFKTFADRMPSGKLVFYARYFQLSTKISEKKGNFKEALEKFKQYKIHNDSLYNNRKTNQIAALQTEFETEKKDQDIRLHEQSIELLNTRNVAQQQEIRQTKLTRNAILYGSAILLIVLGMLYNQYRQKQKSNKEINSKNIELRRLVEEKEWLLKEVHHRVKNNLQTVVSLLESQSAYLKDDALFAIQESQNRIFAMSLIHQKLYQTENTSSIKMAEYLPELIGHLRDMLDPNRKILFDLNIDKVDMDVSQAVPVGLVLNEAITNAMKYAFGDNSAGKAVLVSLTCNAESDIQITIEDNGLGLPAGFDYNRSSGLGFKLMKGLTEDLGGIFGISSFNGTRITILFKLNTPLNKIAPASEHLPAYTI